MARRFELVVSAEDNPYMAWQALVFHFSCLTYLGRAPIIVVHGDDSQLHPLYARLGQRGGRIQRAPTYSDVGGPEYPPRNTPASLKHVQLAREVEFIVLCDPDLVLLRPWPFEDLILDPDEISLDSVAYLFPDDETRTRLEPTYAAEGVDLAQMDLNPFPGGVPHFIPIGLKDSLSAEWLRLIDEFLRNYPADSACNLASLASMWGLDLAIRRLCLRPVITRYTITNFTGRQPLPRSPGSDAALLHYCYGDDVFSKHDYVEDTQISDLWRVRAEPGSIHEALCAQIRAAGAHFGLA
jgi:hypothetical protein